MNEWLKNNAWSLVIALVTLISTFTIYGYRIQDLEKQMAENKTEISAINTQQVQLQVQLAQIATDIQYIKASIDRLYEK